tara:strand:+ start:853 stop:1011 length:159 start_codon:yes stop_codon:yes gene_type:complete
MFNTTELAILHKAVLDMTIKGADAPLVSKLLEKLINAHRNIETSPEPKKSGK